MLENYVVVPLFTGLTLSSLALPCFRLTLIRIIPYESGRHGQRSNPTASSSFDYYTTKYFPANCNLQYPFPAVTVHLSLSHSSYRLSYSTLQLPASWHPARSDNSSACLLPAVLGTVVAVPSVSHLTSLHLACILQLLPLFHTLANPFLTSIQFRLRFWTSCQTVFLFSGSSYTFI